MSQLDYNQTQEYYGEYKQGFFGSVEQIYVCFSAQYVSGRGFADDGTGRYSIIEMEYKIADVEDIDSAKFDGKQCSVVKVSNGHFVSDGDSRTAVSVSGGYFVKCGKLCHKKKN